MGNFTTEKILPKIFAVNAIGKNVFRMSIGFLGSYLLTVTNTANSTIIFGIILTIVSIALISYMSTRLGLKPKFKEANNEFYRKCKTKGKKTN